MLLFSGRVAHATLKNDVCRWLAVCKTCGKSNIASQDSELSDLNTPKDVNTIKRITVPKGIKEVTAKSVKGCAPKDVKDSSQDLLEFETTFHHTSKKSTRKGKFRNTSCSVPCFKKHKEKSCEEENTEPKATPEIGLPQSIKCTDPQSEHFFGTEDTISVGMLKKLGESRELRDILLNPLLQETMLYVDGSTKPDVDIENAMHNNSFVEFADKCLAIVEPEKCCPKKKFDLEDIDFDTE